MSVLIWVIKYERNEYAKRIRSKYEKGLYPERRCNLREPGIRTDGCCNTISTVQKDNYLCIAELKEEKTNTELSEKERSC